MGNVITPEVAANLRLRGIFKDSILEPRQLTDGRYALSENTRTDPRHAYSRPLLLSGAIEADAGLAYSGTNRIELQINGKMVYLSVAAIARAFAIPLPNLYRFEVHKGESGYSGDAANNNRRCELVSGEDGNKYGAAQTLWNSFSFVVGPNHAPFDAGSTHNAITQWHSVDTTVSRSPVFGIALSNGNFRVYTRSDLNGSTSDVWYELPRPADGVVHNVVVAALLGPTGHLDVWLDGVNIVNVDTPIGYYNDDAGARKLAYPHWGIYQANADDPNIHYIANIEWGTDSLVARVGAPLPVTVPLGGWV